MKTESGFGVVRCNIDLPLHQGDPFDRLLIAQAIAEDMTILTSDRAFTKYDVDIVWCGK